MLNKRSLDSLNTPNYDNPQKKSKKEDHAPKIVGFSTRNCSKLLLPIRNYIFSEQELLLRKRSYRMFYCQLRVQFPSLDVHTTFECIKTLKERYQAKLPGNTVPENKHVNVTQKEASILIACQLQRTTQFSDSTIAKLTGLSSNDMSSLNKRLNVGSSILPQRNQNRTKIKDFHIEFVRLLLQSEETKFLTVQEIKIKLTEKFPELKGVHNNTVRMAMIKNGMTYKKVCSYPDERNTERIKQHRISVTKLLAYCLYNKYRVVFIDETALQLHSFPNRAWGFKGVKLSVAVKPKSVNYSIICAVTPTKVLAAQVIKEGTKKFDFLAFICHLISCYDYHEEDRAIVLFLDNASIHRSKVVKEGLQNKVTLLFNAGYSPQLNPVEEFFSKFKIMVRKESLGSEKELILAVHRTLSKFTKENFKGYMRHTLKFMEDSLNHIDIV